MKLGDKIRIGDGEFELDVAALTLFRNGWPVRIQPQPLRILAILLEKPGQVVSRDELRCRIWGESTFVEFDQGLNYSIRQVRLALRDDASNPTYIETLPKQGYRFIAEVTNGPLPAKGEAATAFETSKVNGVEDLAASRLVSETAVPINEPSAPSRSKSLYVRWVIASIVFLGVLSGVVIFRSSNYSRSSKITITQITDFTDSAASPTLSADGKLLAFFRGPYAFVSTDPIYVKTLPNGEPQRVTDDPRGKYNITFSPDGKRIAYTVLAPSTWETFTVPISGGEPHLFLKNAAGLSWLGPHEVLFSTVRTGMHMGVVRASDTRESLSELYFPPHRRGMAHYSFPSPDKRSALVVEMNEKGDWAPCKLISLDAGSPSLPIGPQGPCTSAAWSPDGVWIYFTATVDEREHLWRQRFPNGEPEQLTSGGTSEDGVTADPDNRSVITSMGDTQTSLWLHDSNGDRRLASEGEINSLGESLLFSPDGQILYFMRRRNQVSATEICRVQVKSGKTDTIAAGRTIDSFSVSPEGDLLVYEMVGANGESGLWLSQIDRRKPPRQISNSGETVPHFGANGSILFRSIVGNSSYLERINLDGSHRIRLSKYPIHIISAVSPQGKWVAAVVMNPDDENIGLMAISTSDGSMRRLCSGYCYPSWSPDGNFIVVPVEMPSRSNPGRSLAIPTGPDDDLSSIPPGGVVPDSPASAIPGAISIPRAYIKLGSKTTDYAYVNSIDHRNLFRISLP